MNQLKNSVKKHALNPQDVYQTLNIKKENSFFRKLLIPTTMLAALMLTVFFGSLVSAPTQENANHVVGAIAYFQLEINPQFEIAVDEDGLVVSIVALNDDAKTFELDQYLNEEVDGVIEKLITIATEKGYIDSSDDTDDFVTISYVMIDEENQEDKENVDSIGYRIRARIEASGEVDPKTHVVYVKATIAEKMEAAEKEVPLGMYVINGLVEHEGEMIPVNEFVRNRNALKKMNKSGIIITKRNQDQTNKPEESIDDDSSDTNDQDTTDNQNDPNEYDNSQNNGYENNRQDEGLSNSNRP